MARLLGPDDGDRLCYVLSGTQVRVAAGMTAVVYAASAGDALADILADNDGTPGAAVPGSQLTVDQYGLLPLFWFPDGVDQVWVQVGSGPRTKVDAAFDPRLDSALPLAGGTLTGRIVVNSVSGSASRPLGITGAVDTGVSIVSSAAGGEDDGDGTDTTGRLNLYSFQRADVGSFGENIRRFLMRENAKSMDAWYLPRQDGAMTHGFDGSGVPDADADWVPVAWTGAHWKANDGLSIHGHWSIEVPDSTGAVQTRFEVPFTDQELVDGSKLLGVDVTNIRTNLADLTVRANLGVFGTGVLRVGGGNSVNKDILLSISSDRATSGRRWILRANTDTESGSNAGTNYQLIRHDDTGTALGTALFVQRSDGQITTGAPSAKSARIATVWGTSGIHGFSAQPSTALGSAAGFDGQMTATTDRAFQATVAGDASRRWVVQADGQIEWGDGTNPRDANLYRSAADVLKTDDSLVALTKVTVGQATLHAGAILASFVNGTAPAIFAKATADGTASVAVVSAESSSTSKRLLDLRVTGDTVSRLRVDVSASSSGTVVFGDGSSADTNLYRSAADTLKTDDSFHVGATLRHLGSNLGFYNATAVAKPTVAGSRGGNAALASLLTALANLGLITDSSSA